MTEPGLPSKAGVRKIIPLWRVALWGGAGALLSMPAVAKLFTDAVDWGAGDFLLMAGLLGLTCGAIDIAARRAPNRAYAAGVAVAVVGTLLLIWINLAVGLVGDEGNPLNLLFLGIPAVGIAGAIVSRWRAGGLARTLYVMAALQVASLAALPGGEPRLLIAVGGFAVVWWSAARLFAAGARAASRGIVS